MSGGNFVSRSSSCAWQSAGAVALGAVADAGRGGQVTAGRLAAEAWTTTAAARMQTLRTWCAGKNSTKQLVECLRASENVRKVYLQAHRQGCKYLLPPSKRPRREVNFTKYRWFWKFPGTERTSGGQCYISPVEHHRRYQFHAFLWLNQFATKLVASNAPIDVIVKKDPAW